jgi:hypothetical protein
MEARDAFGRCVMLDEEDSESWNNLASVYLRLGTNDTEAKKQVFFSSLISGSWLMRCVGRKHL